MEGSRLDRGSVLALFCIFGSSKEGVFTLVASAWLGMEISSEEVKAGLKGGASIRRPSKLGLGLAFFSAGSGMFFSKRVFVFNLEPHL